MITTAPATPDDAEALAELLVDCVRGGASVGFLLDLTVDEAEAWWREHLARTSNVVLTARDDHGIVGTGTLSLVAFPNGLHRAEVSKLLVATRARRRGIARTLLRALERAAVDHGRWVLILDTETGSPAQDLYASDGWEVVGVAPDYALTPDGALTPTTFMTKRLERRGTP